MSWKLDETVETSAGAVAAGRIGSGPALVAIVNEIDPGDFERLVAPWLSDEGRRSFYRQFAQADEKHTAEVEPLFGDVRCPVKIIWGEDDPWIPLARGRTLHVLIPQAAFETLPGAGHLPQLEAPERVLGRLDAFLPR